MRSLSWLFCGGMYEKGATRGSIWDLIEASLFPDSEVLAWLRLEFLDIFTLRSAYSYRLSCRSNPRLGKTLGRDFLMREMASLKDNFSLRMRYEMTSVAL